MAEPLDYERRGKQGVERAALPSEQAALPSEQAALPSEQAALPSERVALTVRSAALVQTGFDAEVMRSEDHAAVAAIEVALKKAGVEYHRIDDGSSAGRRVILLVKSPEQNRAQLIAAEIFTRRAKVKKIPRVEMPKESAADDYIRSRTWEPLD